MTTHYRKKTNSFYLEFLGLRYEMTVMFLEWVLERDTLPIAYTQKSRICIYDN